MLRITLIRHAKSAWDDPGLADFDRPLAARGRRAAVWVGNALRERGIEPDLILCSPAARTRETLRLSELPGIVRFEPAIYERRDADYVGLLRDGADEAASSILLVGHNSATATTAALLLDDRGALEFPTAAFAIIELANLRSGQGRLVDYCVPPKD